MARFDIGGYTRYNADRAERGRAPIRPSTFSALEDVGVYAKDIEGWIAASEAVYAAKLAKAAEVADYWKSIAPERGDKPTHGQEGPTYDGGHLVGNPEDYRDSIKVLRRDGTVAVGSELMPLAEWLEYGSEHNPEHGYGARVLEHFGGGSVDTAERVSDKLFVG